MLWKSNMVKLWCRNGPKWSWTHLGLGDADEPSGGTVGFIVKTSMKKGAHLMTLMKSLSLLDTQHTVLNVLTGQFGTCCARLAYGGRGVPSNWIFTSHPLYLKLELSGVILCFILLWMWCDALQIKFDWLIYWFIKKKKQLPISDRFPADLVVLLQNISSQMKKYKITNQTLSANVCSCVCMRLSIFRKGRQCWWPYKYLN